MRLNITFTFVHRTFSDSPVWATLSGRRAMLQQGHCLHSLTPSFSYSLTHSFDNCFWSARYVLGRERESAGGRKERRGPRREHPGLPTSKGHDTLGHSRQEEQHVQSDMCLSPDSFRAPLPAPRRHLPAFLGNEAHLGAAMLPASTASWHCGHHCPPEPSAEWPIEAEQRRLRGPGCPKQGWHLQLRAEGHLWAARASCIALPYRSYSPDTWGWSPVTAVRLQICQPPNEFSHP